MTLMILDDQTNVVQGIMSAIDWASLGFSKIIPVYHAQEARRECEKQTIDILLCDIEMPRESGLSFLKWMRDKGFETECIFLTSHAEFEYAKEAVSLGSFEYIIQPAPYDEIRDAVLRAAFKLKRKYETAKDTEYGRALRRQNVAVINSILRDYLMGYNAINYQELECLGCLPAQDSPGYLVLLQIVYNKSESCHSQSVFQYELDNMLTELFAPYEQQIYLAALDSSSFALLISGMGGYQIDKGGVKRLLQSLCQMCEAQCNLYIACYIGYSEKIKAAPDILRILIEEQKKNVSLTGGVFFPGEQQETPCPEHHSQSQILRLLLQDRLYEEARQSAEGYLDSLAESGKLSRKALGSFYQDILSLYYTVPEEHAEALREAMGREAGMDLLYNASRSIESMKQLLRYFTDTLSYREKQDEMDEVSRVIEYIQNNIEQNIKCSELADYVHLSPNYLTKVFRRETGISLKEYIIREKMKLARKLLTTTMLPVGIISSKVGYDNFSYFSRLYKKVTGISPTEER